MKRSLAAVAVMLAVAPSAWAVTPAVGADQRRDMKALLERLGAEDLAYLPVYVPAKYRVTENQASSGQITVSFTSSKYPTGSTASARHAIAFGAQPFRGKLAACSKGALGFQKVAGKTIYLKQGSVWRCVKAPSGRTVVVYADSSSVSTAEMVHVIASVARIP